MGVMPATSVEIGVSRVSGACVVDIPNAGDGEGCDMACSVWRSASAGSGVGLPSAPEKLQASPTSSHTPNKLAKIKRVSAKFANDFHNIADFAAQRFSRRAVHHGNFQVIFAVNQRYQVARLAVSI